LQKIRLARVKMARQASTLAYIKAKSQRVEMEFAKENGLQVEDPDLNRDAFEVQHHHLLNCLEKTTVRLPLYFIML